MKQLATWVTLAATLACGQRLRANGAGDTPDGALAAHVKEVLQRQLSETRVPGAALVVVKDGRVILAEGYGWADVARKTPMTARTPVRAGSVSKLYTATAAMQLVEAAKLDLNRDVNAMLRGFAVPRVGPTPVTLSHLLTHTAGFRDDIVGAHTRDAASLRPLGEMLARRLPPPQWEAGTIASYSSWDITLAGHLVELACGQSFPEYVDQHIARPLKMTDTTFAQPLPPELASRLARGYRVAGDRVDPYEIDHVHLSPAVSLVTTAHDAAQFMLAHLGDGAVDGVTLLGPATARDMRRRHFANHDAVRGWGMGFSQRLEAGHEIWGHDGGVTGFTSRLYLVPAERFGFFVCLNAAAVNDPLHAAPAVAVRNRLTRALLEKCLPRRDPPPVAARAAGPRGAARYAGLYQDASLGRSSFLKLAGLFEQFPVTAESDGALRLGGGRWLPSAADRSVFVPENGRGDARAFRVHPSGGVTHLMIGSAAYERLAWWQTRRVHVTLAAALLLTLLSGLTWTWGHGAAGPRRWLPVAAAALGTGLLGAYAALLLNTDVQAYYHGPPPGLRVLGSAAWGLAALAAAMILSAVALRRGRATPAGWLVHYLCVAFALLGLLGQLAYWRVLAGTGV